MITFFRKKIILFLTVFSIALALSPHALSKSFFKTSNIISNYFLSIISINENNTNQAYAYLKKSKSLNNKHKDFNVNFVKTLVDLGNFDQAFYFIGSLRSEYSDFDEAYLLKGIKAFSNRNYTKSLEYFNKIESPKNPYETQSVIKPFLIYFSETLANDNKSRKKLNKIPPNIGSLSLIYDALVKCHFNSAETVRAFNSLINKNKSNFSRYNFFLVNYLVKAGKLNEAKKIYNKNFINNQRNLLIKQTNNFLEKKNYSKITHMFNCRNSKHLLAEFFYIISNLLSGEERYKLSNFYLNISLYINKNFYTNKVLLAANYHKLRKYKKASEIYEEVGDYGDIYFWHSAQNLAYIHKTLHSKNNAVIFLENQFKKIVEPNSNQFYDLANFYKDNELYEKSVKYYTLSLTKLPKNHKLRYEIFDKRGTSYERLNLWQDAENDLKMSLKLNPNQPYVLNYLAYSWLDQNKNLNKALKMLEKANKIKSNDPYIIDSLGWAMYLNGNFKSAEEHIRQALEILPFDPIISDHYGDILWKLEKNIQARYFWSQILNFDESSDELKKMVRKKIIFGIANKS